MVVLQRRSQPSHYQNYPHREDVELTALVVAEGVRFAVAEPLLRLLEQLEQAHPEDLQ